ncbi:MAG: drug/metabolite exporter YedA, partial [Myxococcales bacterium]|nr:drug/metabolite exporter YedA [Myxococcales bacterium]
MLTQSSSLAPPLTSSTTPTPATKLSIDPRMIACLAAVYLIWSSTYLAMRIVVTELPPLLSASMRFSVAGLVMLAIARRRGVAWPTARQ